MGKVYAKIKSRGSSNKNRVFLDVPEGIYKRINEVVQETVPYNPDTILEDGAWYEISDFSKTDYAIDIIKNTFESVDFDSLTKAEYSLLDYIYEEADGDLYFQNIGRAKLIRKKGFISVGNDFKYSDDYAAIPINEYADAIYQKESDKLYFRDLSSITRIFGGIGALYREATLKETDDFLRQDFIILENEFSADKVKTPNRKRIALVIENLSKYSKKEKKDICSYILSYCPKLKKTASSFKIGSDEDLTLLLYGLDEKFYTTQVGKEKRIANSVIKI